MTTRNLYRKFHFPIVMDNWGGCKTRGVGIRTRCQSAMGTLSFSWRKETIFIHFTLIIFAVYETDSRNKN